MAAPVDAVGEMSNSKQLHIRRVFSYTILTLFAFLSLFPFFILIINMTRDTNSIQKGFSILPGSYLIKNFKTVIGNHDWKMLNSLKNSLIISGLTALVSTYFSALTAYAIHVYDFKLKKFLFTFILMIMMVPTQVSALGFVKQMSSWHLTNSFIPLIIPSIAAPATFFFMKQYMDSALPLEIVEAARIDGSGEFRTFNELVTPILKPAIAVQAIFTFVSSWNNYFIPALILDDKNKRTLPIVIGIIRSADYATFDMGAVYMAVGISIIPVAIVFLILSKFIIRGIALGAVKG
ncbi:carbohydrate ABC transporter permease [uncultured Ruminococcus sp.]|jgi:multiple sugar transport system permease protein|uniref:carbohydrate ABC transporter permease n=1 Tax=uncultured Ruminococcus sp. TaxID=165186 RepID=UPI0025F6A929|nr:carbohydrate ABC transporter permease [uncultured Ruminococcus sp.]